MRTLFALLVTVAAAFAASASIPRERAFSIEYAVTVKEIPAGAHTVDIWLTEPQDDVFQHITTLQVDTSARYETAAGLEDNHMLHIRLTDFKESIAVTMRFNAVRTEHIQLLDAAAPG